MGSMDRRRRHREELRAAIVDAALAIVSEQGLSALSIRAIAERIEYSSATIYLHFESKEVLLQEVACEGFRRCERYLEEGIARLGPDADGFAEVRALGRAYVRFALENTACFHVMFDIPGVAHPASPPPHQEGSCELESRARIWATIVAAVERLGVASPGGTREEAAVVMWSALHGLVSLYLSGQLQRIAPDPVELDRIVEHGMMVFEHSLT